MKPHTTRWQYVFSCMSPYIIYNDDNDAHIDKARAMIVLGYGDESHSSDAQIHHIHKKGTYTSHFTLHIDCFRAHY